MVPAVKCDPIYPVVLHSSILPSFKISLSKRNDEGSDAAVSILARKLIYGSEKIMKKGFNCCHPRHGGPVLVASELLIKVVDRDSDLYAEAQANVKKPTCKLR